MSPRRYSPYRVQMGFTAGLTPISQPQIHVFHITKLPSTKSTFRLCASTHKRDGYSRAHWVRIRAKFSLKRPKKSKKYEKVGQNPFKNAKNRGKTPQNGQNETKYGQMLSLRKERKNPSISTENRERTPVKIDKGAPIYYRSVDYGKYTHSLSGPDFDNGDAAICSKGLFRDIGAGHHLGGGHLQASVVLLFRQQAGLVSRGGA
ncbi:MAG: hypothetical protein PHO14_04125 [Kiritimatiellae bacterium]|nr:hypothetical protein [Kiritimatiellia bacterium]MDD4341404.1 hypothetical protein [Kiritimatiellia bacterium]